MGLSSRHLRQPAGHYPPQDPCRKTSSNKRRSPAAVIKLQSNRRMIAFPLSPAAEECTMLNRPPLCASVRDSALFRRRYRQPFQVMPFSK
jgi:hypothetical protein